ncbi:MAG: hypothetical protein QF464_06725, partial [Myxococcota bacterium]|nr:hypothetical protein [Myxococcota bacterium]
MSPARSGFGLCLASALVHVGVLSVASTAAATDLRLTVTDTLFSEYRADNSNSNPDDDNYGVFINRLNLVASAGDLTASQRIDWVQFIEAPTTDYVDEIIPERINLRYRLGDWRLMAGDFHRQLGRGIALAIRKVDELGLDVALRGGEVTWSGDAADVSVFAGITNSVNIDAVNQKHIVDPSDLIIGAVTELDAMDWLRVGAYALYMQPDETVGDQTDRIVTVGGTAELQLMDSDLVLYVEGVGQHRETAGVNDVGYAAYLSADLAMGDWTFLLEALFMEAFEQKGSTNTAVGSRFNYSNAPTLERFDQEVLNNRDVAGFRARAETFFMDGDLRVHGSLMYRVTDALDEFTRVDQIHTFVGGEYVWDDGDSRLAGSTGYRHEIQAFTDFDIKTMFHFDVDYQQRLTDTMSLHL